MKTTHAAVCTAIAIALAPFAPSYAQRQFATPDAAADALVQALSPQKPDEKGLAALLGDDWRKFVPVGTVDREDVDAFLSMYRKKHAFRPAEGGRQTLVVGDDGWTFPVPVAKARDGWRFDMVAGASEILARRIGRNELDVISALHAYHDAQTEYSEVDRDGDGVLEYAQTLVSTDGAHDGLYWADDDSGEISPLGPLFGDAGPQADWLGYRYRILAAQGPSAPGGAYDYRLGKDMSRGFALVAWPARYNVTGVKSFMISHDGTVFERDLGTGGESIARGMKTFDPDSAWSEVK